MSLLTPAVVLSAALAIAAGLGWLPAAVLFVAKPLTTALLIAHAANRGHDEPATKRWILAGLVLSLAGDVALLWPREGFLPGLIAFLLAHMAYIAAFSRRARLLAHVEPFVGYALLAGGILALLWPGVPAALRMPVVVYVACLASMAAQAAAVWWSARGTPGEAAMRSAAIGGAFFVASDALLATHRFAGPLPLSPLLVLTTYWTAQWCIVMSLRDRRG